MRSGAVSRDARGRLRSIASLIAVALIAGACGTRLPRSTIVDAATGPIARSAGPQSAAQAGSSADASTATAGAPGATVAGGQPVPQAAGAQGQETGAAQAPAAAKSTIVLGNVGTYSGPIGNALAGARPMLQAWAAWVNDHGGVNGHRVKVISADDGGDPARSASIVKDMVENQKVLAFVGNELGTTLRASLPYLEDKNIPVFGGDMATTTWNESRVLFAQGTSVNALLDGLAATVAKRGGKRVGVLYCVEATSCAYVKQRLVDDGVLQRAGLVAAYNARISIAQPDFTSECLQASSENVDSLLLVADPNSLRRLATSCGRQRYRPRYVAALVTLAQELADEPELDGLVGVVGTFPWFFFGSPSATEYRQAMLKHAPGLAPSAATSQAWVSAKMFERAAARLEEPPTRAQLFEGLWAMRGETLGGLAPPLTFSRGQPSPEARCYFEVTIARRAWVAPQGAQASCPS